MRVGVSVTEGVNDGERLVEEGFGFVGTAVFSNFVGKLVVVGAASELQANTKINEIIAVVNFRTLNLLIRSSMIINRNRSCYLPFNADSISCCIRSKGCAPSINFPLITKDGVACMPSAFADATSCCT